MQGTIGLSLPVVTRWSSNNRMLHSLIENEACLKLALSYPEFAGNPSSRVSIAETKRGQGIKGTVEDPMIWDMVKDIKSFTQPPFGRKSRCCLNLCLVLLYLLRLS